MSADISLIILGLVISFGSMIIKFQPYTKKIHDKNKHSAFTKLYFLIIGLLIVLLSLADLFFKVNYIDNIIYILLIVQLAVFILITRIFFYQVLFNVDFRTLKKQVEGLFDCIISFDNALPHLLMRDVLLLGIQNIYDKLDEGGIFLASIRDYNSVLKKKEKVQPSYIYEDGDRRRITLQIQDQNEDNTYKLDLYLINHCFNECITNYDCTMYKAWSRAEMTKMMQECSFKNIRWYIPEETDFYQPIVVGFRNTGEYGINTSAGDSFEAFMALELVHGGLNSISGRFYEDEIFQVDKEELEMFDKQFPY